MSANSLFSHLRHLWLKARLTTQTFIDMAACSSVPAIEWTRSLKENLKLTMKDVNSFVKVNKAPHSGIVKGYKFFCEGFIKDYEG